MCMEAPLPRPRAGEDERPVSVVRETPCKTVVNRFALGGYSMNCYTGCAHACVYCYARFMQRFHPHAEPWGSFVDVKTNAVEALERQLRRLPPGEVFVSSACDGWQPVEQERGLTRACVVLLLQHGFRVNALTKSTGILRDLDVFAGRKVRVGVTLTTLDEGLRHLWEPGACSVAGRIRILTEARAAGLETSVMFGPLLPFLSDDQDAVDALFERAAAIGVDVIWVDALNPRPKVWEALRPFLDREFPDLTERYARVLFAPPVRAAYVRALRARVERAARRLGLSDRVAGCA